MEVFGSLLTAMVTPFTAAGEVNYQAAGELAEKLVAEGCDGLVICGTTGEAPTLKREERLKLLETVVERVGEEARIIAGTGSYNTSDSIEFSQEALMLDVDGLMTVVPYYNKPPQESLYQHFAAIAKACQAPIMLYNVPGRTSRNLEVDTAVRLAEIDNIVAIKEASGDLEQVTALAARCGEKLDIYSGDDSLTLPIMAVGGSGVVSVAGHLAAGKIRKMLDEARNNNFAEAARLNQELFPLFKAMFVTTNPIPVKTALRLQGREVGGFRKPLTEMTAAELKSFKATLKELGFLKNQR